MTSWRENFSVLVVQAETVGAIGVIRSLGRAGYRVHASSTSDAALGLRSRFASVAAVSPPYDSSLFIPWLRRYVDVFDIRAIVPSEGFLLALRPVFSEFARLLTCGTHAEWVYRALSKCDVHRQLSSGGRARHLPATWLVDPLDALPSIEQLEWLGAPLYVKVDAVHARHWARSDVVKTRSATEALGRLGKLSHLFRKALVQGHVPGQGVGAFFLLHDGRVLAEFMHRRLHEVPHTGGASSYRESWFHEAIRDDALDKLRFLRWQGVAMMEYRWEPSSDRFFFLEMNGRFWGSLHLALLAGVDFPRILVDAFFGRPPESVRHFRLGVRSRLTFPAEIEHVWSKVKDPAAGMGDKLKAVAGLALLGMDPRVHSDLLFPGDRGLYWDEMARTVTRTLGRILAWRSKPSDDTQTAQTHVPRSEQKARPLPAGSVAHSK